MTTISLKLKEAIHTAGFTNESIAPLIGISGATFSHKKKGRIDWRLNECYHILDILKIPRSEITEYFVGGLDKKKPASRIMKARAKNTQGAK